MRRVPTVLIGAPAVSAALAALTLGITAAAGAELQPAAYAASSQVAIFPSSVSFGTQRVGTQQQRSVSVENTGNAPLHVYSVTVSDFSGSYSIAFNGCAGATLQGGQQCQFVVQFRPRAPGQRNTTVYVRDDGPGSTQSVPVWGQATS
jgi:hypothetical protein